MENLDEHLLKPMNMDAFQIFRAAVLLTFKGEVKA